MTQNSWQILITKSNEHAMHDYIFEKNIDTKQAQFLSWGYLPIYALTYTHYKIT